jgi:FAD/FMN-containing dehydrogenase
MDRRRFLGGAAALGVGFSVAGLSACGDDEAAAPRSSPATTAALGGADTGDVPAGAVDDLARQLRGTVLRPGDAGYDAVTNPANGRYKGTRPAVVAQVADDEDVATAIRWADEHGVPPVGRGGGHSYAGFSTTEGLLVDLGALAGVEIDPSSGTAVVGGAAKNRDLFDATVDTGLFLPGGTCLGVGVGGLVLGGGIGYNAHWAGLTSDRLRASQIVVASGELLELDASTNEDLFWACRGGAGGSFGINTRFTFELVEVPSTPVTFYRYEWRGADAAAQVLRAFDDICQSAPAALNAVAMGQAVPDDGAGPREAITVMSRGQFIGPADELRDVIAPLLAVADPTHAELEEMGFWDAQRIFASDEAEQHSWGDVSRYSDRALPDDAIAAWVDLLAACPHRSDDANGSVWSLGWVGGDVVNAVGRTETAYVHRGASTLLRPTIVWPDDAPASVGEELMAWADECIAAVAPHTPNESYQNFPNRRIEDWAEQYYAENLDRLVDVKTAHDPRNLFNNPQSIPVRS